MRRFNPKIEIVSLMAKVKFNSMTVGERIAYANLRTTRVSDLVILTGMDLTAKVFLDLCDRHKQDGRTWRARLGNRELTVYNGGMGAPAAECALTALHHAGARKIIRIGVGNILNPEIQIGDLFVPTQAYIRDETARKYTDRTVVDMSCEILDFVKEHAKGLVPSDVHIHFGTVTSSNYLFAQTREELKAWSEQADFLDLESAFLAAFCAAKGIEGMSVLIASDDKLREMDLFTMRDFPMKKLFENGDLMLRGLAKGIRDYNAEK